MYPITFDRTIKHPVGDEHSNLGASKSLNLEIQPGNSQNHLFHGILCYGLDATRFRPKFRLRPKIVLCFRFLLHRNRKHRNWFRFPFKGKGISAERKISAENFGFLCSSNPTTISELTIWLLRVIKASSFINLLWTEL